MTRIFGYHLSLEMLVLWLVESTICFVLLFWLLADGAVLGDAHSMGALDNAMIMALTIGVVSFALGLYRSETCLETRRLLLKTVVAAAISLPAIWLVGKAVNLQLGALMGWHRAWPMQMLIVWIGILLATRLLFAQAVRKGLFTRRVLLLASETEAARTMAAIGSLGQGKFCVAGTVSAIELACLSQRNVWGVIVGAAAGRTLDAATLQAWGRTGLHVMPEAAFWENHLGRVDTGTWALPTVPTPVRRPVNAILGRALDIACASFLLLLTGPLMLVTALLIAVDSPGPIFYRQERVGLHGRVFTLRKFRSMRVDAEANGPVWAASRDARVTRVGLYIRRLRIDELPQLLNVLTGEMSMVGPRPERPHFVEQLAAVIPGFTERNQVKPGLTGWAQVNFPYGASIEDSRSKLSYDLYYVKHRSLLLDLLILFATVRVVMFQEGAR